APTGRYRHDAARVRGRWRGHSRRWRGRSEGGAVAGRRLLSCSGCSRAGSGWFADVAGNPSRCVEPDRLCAHQRCQVVFDVLQFGDADSSGALVAEFFEDRFALAEHVDAAFGYSEAFAAGVAWVRFSGYVAAFL